jgi:hypothetical protein
MSASTGELPDPAPWLSSSSLTRSFPPLDGSGEGLGVIVDAEPCVHLP